jgi:phage/plasmid-associated DNA primase
MLRRGFSEGQVMTVLTHESWFSGEKWRDSGRNDSYVTYSIIQAQQLVVSEPLSKPPEIATKLSEQYSLLYYLGEWYVYDPDKGFYERGESFLRRAIQAISGPKWTGDLENNSLKYLQPNEEVAELPNTGLINVQNGMLRPETGELVPHGAAYLSLTQVNARWDPTAATSEVDQFVSAVLPQQFVSHWWMFCGYCLYTDVPLPYRCILALVGPRRTGKSTLLNAVQAFLGEYNVSNVPLTDFGGQGNQFTLANLVGKLLNVDSEADYESYLALTNNLKALGSGERVRIEQKYMKGTSMHLPVKLSFAMNGYPRPPHGTDEAFYDRWVILDTKKPDRKAFTMDNPDTLINADRRLLSVPENRNAWLLRSVQGLMELHRAHGFPKLDTTDEFRRQRDSVVAFWQTCTTGGDIIRGTPLSTFYRQYQRWDLEAGGKPVSSHRFRTRSFEIIDEGIVENTMYRLTDRHMVYGRTPAVGMRIGGQEVT